MFLYMFKSPYLDEPNDAGGNPVDDVILPEPDSTPTEPVKEEPKEPAKSEPGTQPKIELKYNHETKEYSLDEIVPLAQKGMNYDKLQEKLNSIQNDPRLSKYDRVQQVSKLLGYQTDDELLDALYNTYYNTQAQENGYTPQQVKRDHELSQKEKALSQKEKTLSQKEKDNAMYTNFTRNFPDVKAEMIKPETWVKVEQGMDLSTAYIMQQNTELQTKIKTFEQNASNADKAPVSGVTEHGSKETTSKDPFEIGFDSIK